MFNRLSVLLLSIATLVTVGALVLSSYYDNDTIRVLSQARCDCSHYVSYFNTLNTYTIDSGALEEEEEEKPASLGARNMNPLNVHSNPADPWIGQLGVDAQGHAIFSSLVYGTRAAALTLRTYAIDHKLTTIRGILGRFAETKSPEYEQFLSSRMSLEPTEKFNVIARMPELLKHMAWFESGIVLSEELLAPYDILSKL